MGDDGSDAARRPSAPPPPPLCRALSLLTIIFSTTCRVSPSRSPSLLFSGSMRATSSSGSPSATVDHHSIAFSFARDTISDRPPAPAPAPAPAAAELSAASIVQEQSSGLTFLWRGASRRGGRPLSPTRMRPLLMSTTTSFPLAPSGTGTVIVTSLSVCVQE
jgi:hypothetical protein